MPIYDKLFPDEVCPCGRKRQEVHCTSCGSSNVIGSSRESRKTIINGIPFTARGWKCRRCSNKFTDEDRMRCCANPVQLLVKTQRVLDEVLDLPYEEKVKLAFEALAKHGKNPVTEVSRLASERSKIKPFEIGDDRGMISQALSNSGVTIEEVKSSISLDKEDGETQIIEEKL